MKTNMIKIIPIFLLIASLNVNAQETSCEELLHYRNNTVMNIYSKSYNKYKISTDHINEIKKIRTELIDDIGMRTSDIVVLPMVTKLASNLLEDMINICSPKGQVVNLMVKDGLSSGSIAKYKAFQAGLKNLKTTNYLLEEEFGKLVLNEFQNVALKNLGTTGSIYKGVKNLKDNINNFKEFDILKKDVTDQLRSIENSLIEYNKAVELSSNNFNQIDGYLNSIDEYLKENCKKEVARNPIDLESKLWDTNDENSTDEVNMSFNTDPNYLLAQLSDPEFLKKFNFKDTEFVNEIMALVINIDYNSEASLKKFTEDLNRVMKKYLKKP